MSAQPAATESAPTKPADEEVIRLNEFEVKGERASIGGAQEIKQNYAEFVDAILAVDIGKLPDNTVADALQRVAGIQVTRSGGEASTVVIRGLPNLQTTINGYEAFTGVSRGVALQDIPAEMLAGVEAYKSVGADKIEGGVAGLIDVRLHRPFDFKNDLTLSGNVRGLYSDQADKYSYSASGLVSKTWNTSLGKFGVLLDVSHSRRQYQDQIFDNYVHAAEEYDTTNPGWRQPAGYVQNPYGYYADNFGYQVNSGDRKRDAVSLMLQWKTKSGIELYSDLLYTGYHNKYRTNFFVGIPSWANGASSAISNVTLYPEGYEGYFVDDPRVAGTQATRFVQSFTSTYTNTVTSMQSFKDSTNTMQGTVGAIWSNDKVKLTAEYSHNSSTVRTRGVILDLHTVTPKMTITYNDSSNPTVDTYGYDYTNPANYVLNQYYDQWSRSHSVQDAFKTTMTYTLIDSPFIKSVELGGRYAQRLVNYQAPNNSTSFGLGDISTSDSRLGSGLGSVEGSSLSISGLDVSRWYAPNADWLLNNVDLLRKLGGQGDRVPNPANAFGDTEKTAAVHVVANYKIDVADKPLDGALGARFVDAHTSLAGFQQPVINGTTDTNAAYEKTTTDTSNWAVLPSLNARLKLTDKVFLRGSVTKSMTRPNFSDLNPATSLTLGGTTLVNSGSGGNPNLAPIKSTNYDLSLEYYFAKTSMASVTGFYRDLTGYIQTYGGSETYNGVTYNVSRPRSTDGYLQGIEATYAQFFDFLPPVLQGLGLQTNFTYIKGETTDTLTQQKARIAQVSKYNYNVVLIYEKQHFSSRLAYTWRGEYIESFGQAGLQGNTVWVEPTGQLDFSASYEIVKGLSVTFDATNLLDSKYKSRFGTPTQSYAMFSRDVHTYDKTYELGLRYSF
jgi:TonB-dependent receptor